MDCMPCTLIVPAAGDSLRFSRMTSLPKGLVLIQLNSSFEPRPMIEHCIPQDWLDDIIVVCKEKDHGIFRRKLSTSCQVLAVMPTSGQAETVYLGVENVQGDVLIVNSDNAFEKGVLRDFLAYCRRHSAAIGAITFRPSPEDRYRYGFVDGFPIFERGEEKVSLFEYALAGAFYFTSAALYRHAYEQYSLDLSKSGGGGPPIYISQLFGVLNCHQRNFLIGREALHEWGTAELLEADETVRVYW